MKKTLVLGLSLFLLNLSTQAQSWLDLMDQGANFYKIQKAAKAEYFNADGSTNPGWKQYSRWEYMMEQRVYPSGVFPNPSSAYKEYKKIHRPQADMRSQAIPSWNSRGPSVRQNLFGLGRINFISFHPSDTNIFFVGAPAGGLWKTTDAGTSYNVLNDTMSVIGCSDLVIHPQNDSIMYLATGDRDGSDTYSVGVMKSTDGGISWDTTGLNWNVSQTRTIGRLIINEEDPSIIIAATSNGVYKTINAGQTWALKQSGSFKDIEFRPGDTSIVYVSGASFLRSINGGESFSSVSVTTGTNRMEIAVTAANPDKVYIVASNSSNQSCRGVFLSIDSGASFAMIHGNNPNLLGRAINGSDLSVGQGWYDLAIAASPTDENKVIVGGINSWRTTDGGVSWNISSHWLGQGAPAVHADCHEMTYHPNGNLYAGNDGGVNFSPNDGLIWFNYSNTLVITQSYRIGISQHTYGDLLMGNQDNGTNLSWNSGQFREVNGGDGFECIISHTDPFHMWSSIYFGDLYRSLDGGLSFASATSGINESGAWLTPFIMDPWQEDILYAGFSSIFKTTNKGLSWAKSNNSSFPSGGKVRAMAQSKFWPDRILASKGNNLYLSQDGGTNWAKINNTGTPNLTITYMAFDESDLTGETIWLTFSGYSSSSKAYKTTNLGTSWTNESSGLPNVPANCVVVDDGSPSKEVYVGTDIGVYYKNDSSSTFINYSKGLPNVIITELEIHKADEKMIAGTYGRGIWDVDLLTKGLTGLDSYQKKGDLELMVWPNPANQELNLKMKGNPGNARLSIIDSKGSMVFSESRILNGKIESENLLIRDLNLGTGIYFIRLESGNYQLSQKLIIQ